jgi:predicted benzoate:H+ symporter BenE
MNLLHASFREIVGLFLDDEFLAVAVLIVVGAAAVLTRLQAVAPLAVGAVLLAGCLGVLLMSVWRTATGRRR